MEADLEVACGEGDPIIVLPWSDPEGSCAYVDLTAQPESIELLPESRQWPELSNALRMLNAPVSSVLTVKCDAWQLEGEELVLDFAVMAHGYGSYIDVTLRQLSLFGSRDACLTCAQQLTRKLRTIEMNDARVECILRPAIHHQADGYAFTLYAFGYGERSLTARQSWSEALAVLVHFAARMERYNGPTRASSSIG